MAAKKAIIGRKTRAASERGEKIDIASCVSRVNAVDGAARRLILGKQEHDQLLSGSGLGTT